MRIETYYTGGGITIAELDIDNGKYAVVSTEAPDFMSIYKLDNGEKTYLPEDMVTSSKRDDLAPELKDLHDKMVEKLNTH